MSTSCAIGMKMADGTIQAIRCHWDGYPTGVGIILCDSYNESEKVLALLALGELSCLGRELASEPGQGHCFSNPQNDIALSYHRDRGEPLKPPVSFKDNADFLHNGKEEMLADYLYLFDENQWWLGSKRGFYEPLADWLSTLKN